MDENKDALATWFRVKDKTSELIGGRQASTLLTLAALAGRGEPTPQTRTSITARASKAKAAARSASKPTVVSVTPTVERPPIIAMQSGVGLTVRVEVNLPAAATADVYDAIFTSIRRSLIDRG
jgi:hypothetical protein